MILDFKDISKEEALYKFNQVLSEIRGNEDSLDIIIQTGSNYEISGVILELIDELNLDHNIKLGGIIEVTVE